MTVKDLIRVLQDYDENLPVMRPGYEGGYQDLSVAEIRDMVLNVHPEWYYGDHDTPGMYRVPCGPTVVALVLY